MSRGRKPNSTAVEQVGPNFSGATPPDMAAEETRARQIIDQQETSIRAVAMELGYELPADCTDPDMIQRDIAANMRRTVESMIEVGRGLLVLKVACPHGEFQKRLDVLGFEQRAARRYMQVVAKFAKRSTSTALLEAAGTQSKLLEMLVLDDEQIEELELTGQTGELHLDDVATMSVKELRAALREEREEKKAITRIATERAEKLDELASKTEKKRKRATDPWPDEVAGLKDDLHGLSKIIDEALGKTLTLIDATEVAIQPLEPGSDAHNGFKTVVHHLGETIERMVTLIAGLRHEYETRLGDLVAIDKTHTVED